MSAGYKKINLALKTQLKKIDKDGYHNPSSVNDDKLEKLKKVLLRKVSSNQNESAILPNVLKYNYQETPGHYKEKSEYNKINMIISGTMDSNHTYLQPSLGNTQFS